MRFFFDNCMSPKFAPALLALCDNAIEIKHLREKFNPAIRDVDWLGQLSKEGNWVVISGDARITRNPQNRLAWQSSGLTGFFLKGGWSSHTLWDQAWRLIRWWPQIMDQASKVAAGAGFLVPVNFGKFEQVKLGS